MRKSSADKPKRVQAPGNLSPLLNVPEAAVVLGLKNAWTLYQWVSQKRISYVKIGRLTKFRQEDLAAFIEQNRHGAVSFERRPT
jgi:excisionase family DNA binding protein